jgi:hypothetical protein
MSDYAGRQEVSSDGMTRLWVTLIRIGRERL